MSDSTPIPNNPKLVASNQVVHVLIYDVVMNLAKKDVLLQAPWLAVPPMSWVFTWIWGWASDIIYNAFANSVAFDLIQDQTGAEVDAYTKAQTALAASLQQKDLHVISQAQQDFNQAAVNLIHFNGS